MKVVAIVATIVWLGLVGGSSAQSGTYLVSPSGKYLGNLNSNQYDPNSVANPYGRYGSKYRPDSINNPYGQYGSEFSNESANNPYATEAPMIFAPCHWDCY